MLTSFAQSTDVFSFVPFFFFNLFCEPPHASLMIPPRRPESPAVFCNHSSVFCSYISPQRKLLVWKEIALSHARGSLYTKVVLFFFSFFSKNIGELASEEARENERGYFLLPPPLHPCAGSQ